MKVKANNKLCFIFKSFRFITDKKILYKIRKNVMIYGRISQGFIVLKELRTVLVKEQLEY